MTAVTWRRLAVYGCVAASALCLGWVLADRFGLGATGGAIELLPPTGPLAVGRTSFHWVDPAREHAAAPPGAQGEGEVVAHLWYPAQPSAATRAPYMPDLAVIEAALGRAGVRDELGPFYQGIASARTHAVADADVAAGSDKFPVVLLTHGLRYGALGYSTLTEDLASHGYVVVGVDHPATAFAVLLSDGRVTRFPEAEWSETRTSEEKAAFEQSVIDHCAAELVFALDQLERIDSGAIPSRLQGRLDLGRVGIFGQSFGGLAAVRACRQDARFKAAVVSDSFGRAMNVERRPDGSTIDQPVMIHYARRVPRAGLAREAALRQTPGEDLEAVLGRTRREFCQSVQGGSYELTLDTPGIIHESFSDLPLLESGLGADTMCDRQRTISIVRLYTRAFFDRYLRERAAPALDEPPADPSEVELTRHTFRGE